MGRRLRSVRVQVTVAATLVTAVAVGLAAVALVRAVRGAVEDRIRDRAEEEATLVASRLADGVPPGDVLTAAPTSAVLVQVVAPDGHVVAGPAPGPGGAAFEVPVPAAGTVDGEVVRVPSSFGGVPVQVAFRSVAGPDGEFTVVAQSPLDEVQRSVDALVGVLRLALPGLVLAVGAAAWVVAGRALRPVEAIRAEVDSVQASTIHRRVPEPGTGDEVDRLARTMNAMLDRLEAASVRQRQFVADASHELRSPVATIRTELEVALARPDRADWPGVAASLLAEEERLESLVDDLLLLASLDEEPAPVRSAPVDLAALAAGEAARTRAVPVTVDAGAAVVHGSGRELAKAVGNLLDNAAAHAAGVVAVTVRADGATAVVHVDDDGPGVPEADRERIFDRFTRLEPARSRADGGAGLGLALVRRIAERHGGRVTVTDGPLGGARFTLALPLTRT